MSRIGIMGGTFNPIHLGHLLLAECARDALSLDEVWFVPTGHSYMKEQQRQNGAKMPLPEQRLEMTELALRDNPHFSCLDMEVRRGGNTYSYETLEELKRIYPHHSFFFIFGADCLYTIENWKEPSRIFGACEIAAAVRGDASEGDMAAKIRWLEEHFGAHITLLPFRRLEISSTEIRERVKNGKSILYMTPGQVISYIAEKGLYGE